jgi:hypothetical protein
VAGTLLLLAASLGFTASDLEMERNKNPDEKVAIEAPTLPCELRLGAIANVKGDHLVQD